MQITSALKRRGLIVLSLLALVVALLPGLTLAADPDFRGNSAFLSKWQRTDKPVADGKTARSWLWGPNTIQIVNEPYEEAPGKQRLVAYLDKARMEINNPSSNFVTNGLLVKELISGQEALGDVKTLSRLPADISVAGDPGNPGPTYATFRKVSTLNGTDNPSTNQVGQSVTATIVRDGTTGTNATLGANVKVAYFEPTLKHNIPDVFWNFMNQKGPIWDGSKFVDNQLVFDWLDAMGYPITDAYWSRVVVGGQTKDVLIQAFERRVLTYTPSNSPAFQVEMGNVGQHYLAWRIDPRYDGTNPPGSPTTGPTPPTSTPPPAGGTPPPSGGTPPPSGPPVAGPADCIIKDIPGDVNGVAFAKCGPAGFQQVAFGFFMQGNENVTITLSGNGGQVGSPITVAAQGGVVQARVDIPTSASAGLYSINMVGSQSNNVATVYFKVQDGVGGPTVIAQLGADGKTVTLLLVGFPASDKVELSVTSPSGTTSVLKQVTTGSSGGYTNVYAPNSDFPNFKAGAWTITAKSTSDSSKTASVTVNLS
jgi:hypothetical protein